MPNTEEINLEELEAASGGAQTPAVSVKLPCTHVVSSGENLWVIAKKYYGNGAIWQKIYDANKEAIGSNPDLIRPGLKLTIPA